MNTNLCKELIEKDLVVKITYSLNDSKEVYESFVYSDDLDELLIKAIDITDDDDEENEELKEYFLNLKEKEKE